ncbi:CcoQ/FixQ family Cbb3-type cytochrome c oxidase assembly chaperone [Alloyangia pacifica]|uniref:CcoQ/FixQ family Cbb3-type cytochrome c oxidase assembly chaperone n=1 Tax=Alloyangia pacifica TaxID=311180 RepID=A0A2U8HGC7_9RHOB|nr:MULTISPECIES: cbb3-type cytochrome c oxidase subunit 3 [Roseobacteraceae]AWI84076.1 CcoQ/FixQ family Cbb3-type cytochrome c oxidase assembly chaperone [Alloyangia pacifica]NDV48284.1 cbb3-type cytochrome c oxidase subunit 3 [Salipiger sp. PrR003]NDW35512.1 cbb3-type cytochrome c oxidase subunit 3 [Salipiger sp. PrR007]
MDTYSGLRHFADSWGLLLMFLFFVGMIVWIFRPGARRNHDDAASIPLRNDTAPAAPDAPEKPAHK